MIIMWYLIWTYLKEGGWHSIRKDHGIVCPVLCGPWRARKRILAVTMTPYERPKSLSKEGRNIKFGTTLESEFRAWTANRANGRQLLNDGGTFPRKHIHPIGAETSTSTGHQQQVELNLGSPLSQAESKSRSCPLHLFQMPQGLTCDRPRI